VSEDELCPVETVKAVDTASTSAEQSELFNAPTDLATIVPSDLTLEKDYTFYSIYTAKGGAQLVSSPKTFVVGCTPSMNIT